MVSAEQIVELQERETRALHQTALGAKAEAPGVKAAAKADSGPDGSTDWLDAVRRQHRANFELWHIEDEARAPGASDADLAGVKRRIDLTNQMRNDLAEQLDLFLLGLLAAKGL